MPESQDMEVATTPEDFEVANVYEVKEVPAPTLVIRAQSADEEFAQTGETKMADSGEMSVLSKGHMALRENATEFKAALMTSTHYDDFLKKVESRMQSSTEIPIQATNLAILLELDVQDVTRIGEPLTTTLRRDLETKARGDFEFVKGDRNLASALLKLMNQEGKASLAIEELCFAQTNAGIATPFDYRRLTLHHKGKFEETSEAQWLDFLSNLFEERPTDSLKRQIEVGRSFGSTKPRRYSDEQEALLRKHMVNPEKLMDIGGSTGVSTAYLMNKYRIPIATVTDARTETELRQSFYDRFQKKPNINYVLGERGNIVRATPDDENYDVVTVNNVLVHILNKEAALGNIIPRINNGGILVIQDGYNTNPPRTGFRILRKENDRIKIVEK